MTEEKENFTDQPLQQGRIDYSPTGVDEVIDGFQDLLQAPESEPTFDSDQLVEDFLKFMEETSPTAYPYYRSLSKQELVDLASGFNIK